MIAYGMPSCKLLQSLTLFAFLQIKRYTGISMLVMIFGCLAIVVGPATWVLLYNAMI
jgi:hypothetical protein